MSAVVIPPVRGSSLAAAWATTSWRAARWADVPGIRRGRWRPLAAPPPLPPPAAGGRAKRPCAVVARAGIRQDLAPELIDRVAAGQVPDESALERGHGRRHRERPPRRAGLRRGRGVERPGDAVHADKHRRRLAGRGVVKERVAPGAHGARPAPLEWVGIRQAAEIDGGEPEFVN